MDLLVVIEWLAEWLLRYIGRHANNNRRNMKMRLTINPVSNRIKRESCKECGGRAKHKKTCPVFLDMLRATMKRWKEGKQ